MLLRGIFHFAAPKVHFSSLLHFVIFSFVVQIFRVSYPVRIPFRPSVPPCSGLNLGIGHTSEMEAKMSMQIPSKFVRPNVRHWGKKIGRFSFGLPDDFGHRLVPVLISSPFSESESESHFLRKMK